MNERVTPLTWQTDIKNRMRSENIGSDFILLNDFSSVPMFMYPFKLDMLIVMICTQGSVRGTIDFQHLDLHAPFAIHVQPNQPLQYEYISKDFAGHCLILSRNFIPELIPLLEQPMLTASAIRVQPYAQLNETQLDFVSDYFLMLKRFTTMPDNPYKLESVKHLTFAYFYWAHTVFTALANPADKNNRQTELINNFTRLVRANYRQRRDLAFYAEQLNRSPKYLSQLINAATGKTASEWIDDFVMLEAKALLKSTNMTIQQISDELNFASQSFFGKYFKRYEGVSPKSYREG